jgi:hypothetical protein
VQDFPNQAVLVLETSKVIKLAMETATHVYGRPNIHGLLPPRPSEFPQGRAAPNSSCRVATSSTYEIKEKSSEKGKEGYSLGICPVASSSMLSS